MEKHYAKFDRGRRPNYAFSPVLYVLEYYWEDYRFDAFPQNVIKFVARIDFSIFRKMPQYKNIRAWPATTPLKY